jgi:hypothetical protein
MVAVGTYSRLATSSERCQLAEAKMETKLRIDYCGIGEISYVSEDGIYVGEVLFQFKDEHLPNLHQISAHSLKILVKVRGEKAWNFERVQESLLGEARHLMSMAGAHVADATVKRLEELNALEGQPT